MTGDIIKKLRKQKGLTQQELGKLLGVQKSAIAKYENGRVSNLKKETISKLAEIFNVFMGIYTVRILYSRPVTDIIHITGKHTATESTRQGDSCMNSETAH